MLLRGSPYSGDFDFAAMNQVWIVFVNSDGRLALERDGLARCHQLGQVLAELPDLRIGVMELSAIWVPMFLLTLDGGFDFHARFNGAPLTDLPLKPSEYVRRQVRVAAFQSMERMSSKVPCSGQVLVTHSSLPFS